MKNSNTVSFALNLIRDTMHNEESYTENYIGRAEITTEKAQADEGGGCFTSVEITALWLGIDAPDKYKASDFRSVSIPSGKLLQELETAAIDQLYLPIPVTLPDEIEEFYTPIQVDDCVRNLNPFQLSREYWHENDRMTLIVKWAVKMGFLRKISGTQIEWTGLGSDWNLRYLQIKNMEPCFN